MILPYLPFIKQKRRERRRQENSNVFNICVSASELKTEDEAPTPVRLSSYVKRHSSAFTEVAGSCDDGGFSNVSVMQHPLQSLQLKKCIARESKFCPFFFFFCHLMIAVKLREKSFIDNLSAPTRQIKPLLPV